MPITKHNFTVRRVEELADTMRSAFRIAQSGRKGPVLVDIPKDVTAAVCEFTPKKPEPSAPLPPSTQSRSSGQRILSMRPSARWSTLRRRAQRSLLPAAA